MSFHTTHPNLARYVESKNGWDKLMKRPARFDLSNFTRADKAQLMEEIDCDLSPENLTCDGELSGENLRRKAAYLKAIKAELESF